MANQSEVKILLKILNIDSEKDEFDLEKFEKLIKFEEFEMGKPIILADEIPKDIYILLNGQVRQLIQNPVSGEIMTLGLFGPNHVLGLKSLMASAALEFVTAASNCKFAKINYQDWQKFNKNKTLEETVEAFEILPILLQEKLFSFSNDPKKIRSNIKEIAQRCKVEKFLLNNKKTKLKLDQTKNWYFAFNSESITYGLGFNFKKIDKSIEFCRVIGIPKTNEINNQKDINQYKMKTKNMKTKTIVKNRAICP